MSKVATICTFENLTFANYAPLLIMKLPPSIKNFGQKFRNISISIPSAETMDRGFFFAYCSKLVIVTISYAKSISQNCFHECDNLQPIVLQSIIST